MSAKQICHQRPPWWAGHPERSERARSEATSKNPARGGRKATERSDRDLKARGVGYADPQTVSDERSEELTGCVPPLLMPFLRNGPDARSVQRRGSGCQPFRVDFDLYRTI